MSAPDLTQYRSRRTPFAVAAGVVVAGGVAVWVAMAALPTASAVVRIGVSMAGAALMYVGVRELLRLTFGRRVELGLWLATAWIVLLSAAAALADVLPLAEARDPAKTLLEANLVRPDLLSHHPFGTDRQGLDILGELLYGARVSLAVGLGAVLIGGLVGGTVGLLAGFYRGKAEAVIGLLTDSMLAFPPLILLLGLAAMLEPSVRNVTLALAVLSIPTYVRLSRANTLVFTEREFVLTARAMGARNRRLLFRELAPNVGPALVSYAFVVMGVVIVAEAALSFLGLSIQRPDPTWGNMIAAGQFDFERHPHLVFVPATVLFLTVFSLNRIGEKARSLWDPRKVKL